MNTTKREKVRFASGATECVAWHYPADNGACVIMAGGLAVTKEPATDLSGRVPKCRARSRCCEARMAASRAGAYGQGQLHAGRSFVLLEERGVVHRRAFGRVHLEAGAPAAPAGGWGRGVRYR